MKLAIFDFDGTLISTDTLPALAKEWIKQRRPRINYILMYLFITPVLIGYKVGLLSKDRFKYLAVINFNRIFCRMTRQEVNDFFTAAYFGLAGLFNPLVLDELQDSIANGYHCILLSGAYTELMEVVGTRLGFNTVLGTPMNFKNGIFEHRKIPAIVEGRGKLEILTRTVEWDSVNWQASRSYGNSYSDLGVMEIVGEPVAVNPDPQLLAHAREKGWRIITP